MYRNLLTYVFVAMLINGCNTTRYITEQHIKNHIQEHTPGQFSNIRTYTIFKGTTSTENHYLELTGYKHKSVKGLVIGTDRIYSARKRFKEDVARIRETEYIHLNHSQCKSIVDNYNLLAQKIKSEKNLRIGEEVYHDFTISEDCYISFRKAKGSSNNTYRTQFWIKGEKYNVSTSDIAKSIKKFLEY